MWTRCVVIFLSSVMCLVTGANICPDSTWKVFDGKQCIKAFEAPQLAWDAARQSCQKHGGDLVQIRDRELNEFVRQLLLYKERYWIGSFEGEDGEFKYVNGNDSIHSGSYHAWREGEPNKQRPSHKYCVEIIGNRNGRWKVKPCQMSRRYVCQVKTTVIDKWDDLKVTWGRPGLPGYFNSMPRTAQDALNQGFKKVSDCDVHANWRGARYVENDDYALVLLYDINGYIAGIQIRVPPQKTGYPHPEIQPPFVKDGDDFVVTAYFVDPSIICTTGRNSKDFEIQGTGTQLFIQNGTKVESENVPIPLHESGLVNTKWVKQSCFPTMGRHYWYGVREDMSCNEFYPVFLMYNNNRLNAFGWSLAANISSRRVEHPPDRSLPVFFQPVPKCLLKEEHLTTLHIYMTSDIQANKC